MYQSDLDARWHLNPSELNISKNMLHLWCLNVKNLPRAIDEIYQILSMDEKQRAERLLFDIHKQQFIAARGFLKIILSKYLGVEPEKIEFTYGDFGKPVLSPVHSNNKIEFNLSHSGDLVIYAITYQRKVGIDIEFIGHNKDIDSLIADVFSIKDRHRISNLLQPHKRQEFYKAWTIMEAYLKATGEGLGGINNVNISPVFGEKPAKIIKVDGDGAVITKWSNRHIQTAKEYITSLVVEGYECLVTDRFAI